MNYIYKEWYLSFFVYDILFVYDIMDRLGIIPYAKA